MDEVEADLLRLAGYNSENTQACRDYTAGKLTIEELWPFLCRNAQIVSDELKRTEPKNKDRVKRGDDWGHIVRIDYPNEEVYVFFYLSKERENFPLDYFSGNYDSRGGHTTWDLDEYII